MGVVRRLLFRRSYEQADLYRDAWQAHNPSAKDDDGPLWLVLGDSAALGVGASSHLSGYVGAVLGRLGPQWRVVNLSRSGARTRDVVDVQLPAAAGLDAQLVTALVGGNDALGTKQARWERDVRDLCAALPRGAVVGTVARGVLERKTRRVNEVIRASAAERGLLLADLWAHTGPPYRGLYFDGFHPNDAGYAQWVSALELALQQGGHLPE